MDQQDELIAELKQQLAELKQQLAETKRLLALFVDDYPCRLDHHGFCQEHSGIDDDGVCLNVKAKAASGRN